MPLSRKLAAIMFTDIVGYTSLMQQSESSAIKIRERHRKVFNSCHVHYHGQIIQYYGDGTLSIFDSAVDAVRCAIDIQKKLLQDAVVPLRIGIHLGDIVLDDTDIIGDSVNLASRVESIGQAGAVLISNNVMEAIKSQDDLSFRLLGAFHFKNDDHPRDIYAMTTPGLVIPQKNQISGKLEESTHKDKIRSLAVLPFDNYTGEKDKDYMVAGMHDHLITTLSQLGSLRIISKTSTLRYKNSDKPIPEIASELSVDALVEASVSKLSDNIRINIQLIKAFPEEDHLWAQVFDYPANDIFSLYNEVVSSISDKIHLVLTKEEDSNLSNSRKVNPEAYQSYLKGRFHWEKLSARDFELALEYFEKSIQTDPSFAPPYAAIANTVLGQVQMGLVSPIVAMPKIYEYNQKALALDSEYPDSHYMTALLSFAVEWNWQKAEEAFQNAIDSNPNNSLAHAFYGHLLLIQKRYPEALSKINKAQDLDPNNPLVLSLSGIVLFHNGDITQALNLGKTSYQIDPNNILTLRLLEMSYHELDDFENAFEIQRKIQQSDPASRLALEEGFAKKDYAYGMELLAKSKEKLSQQQFVQPVWVALAFNRAGMYGDAVRWLETGHQMHDQDMPYVFVFKKFEVLKENPRYLAIAKKMNLPY